MKMLAQDGFGPGDKISKGFEAGMINGAILSARYRNPVKLREQIAEIYTSGRELLIDPEFYAMQFVGKPNAKLGVLEQWAYPIPRRSALITGSGIAPVIKSALEIQARYNRLSGMIAPNIYVESANSIDAAIALNFIAQTKIVADELNINDRPVYASLIIGRDVLASDGSFTELLNALTALESPPDGIYVVVGSGGIDEDDRLIRSDIFHDHVIAGWMMLNHAFSINGLKVINGCSDLLSPLLGICGAYGVSTGWFSSLRQFSIGRYIKPKTQGGAAPLVRYVSNPLLARIKQTEFNNYVSIVPEIKNKLSSDLYYEAEPTRAEEALQTWQAISKMCDSCSSGKIKKDLVEFERRIDHAKSLWSRVEEAGFTGGVEAQYERLDAMLGGISLFREWAELT
ncbi:MAG: hypothetical protein R6X19_09635 [Kiritimatiellia bacterium]